MHMQISVKLVAEACDDFKILTHTSKGEQINFKFLLFQFMLVSEIKLSQTLTLYTMIGSRNFYD